MGGILGLVIVILDIIAIVDVIKGSLTTGMKTLWIILIVIFPILGLILYFLIGRKK